MRGKKVGKGIEIAGVFIVVFILWLCSAVFFRGNRESLLLQSLYRMADRVGYAAIEFQSPTLHVLSQEEHDSLLEAIESQIVKLYPLYTFSMEQKVYISNIESELTYEMILTEEGADEDIQEDVDAGNDNSDGETGSAVTPTWDGNLVADEEAMYPINSIGNYETALEAFYHVDSTTMMGENLLNVGEFLSKDMTIDTQSEGPKVLIYHTHSQEGYADSDKTVVDLGNKLAELLQNKYGISVLHHTGEYDVVDRDSAYSVALPEITKVLEENPTIEVVIDLHRDGVNEDTHLVTTIDGKQVAQIMFFNGISQTQKNGVIDYLANPNLADNLAFSFQMQLAAKTYYPGFTRDIYIRGYRFNMHLKPKSLLVEVGAQTNTYEEASNAMDYLAEILYRVLTVKR